MCILLVEDDTPIREILADELESRGFQVCEAESGDQAASLIDTPPSVFSLLITDIHMPGSTNGLEVARLMRLRYPALPIVYTTGRPDTLNVIGPLGPLEALVVKPYMPTDVLAIVMRLLSTRPPRTV